MNNPYNGLTFFQFFFMLAKRVLMGLQGDLSFDQLATDEIQVLTLVCLGLCTAPLGVFLYLRKMTMLANALSHTLLLGIVFSFMWTKSQDLYSLTLASLLTGLFTTLLTEAVQKIGRLQKEASIALVFTSLFALGILFANLFTRNAHIGIDSVMGNVDALHKTDLLWMLSVFFTLNGAFYLFFRGLKITSFDPNLAKILGFSLFFYTLLLMSMVSLTAIAAFKAVGVLMFLAFLTGPVATASLFSKTLKGFIVTSCLIALVSALLGCGLSRHLLTSYHLPLSTGGITTCTIGVVFLCAIVFKQLPSFFLSYQLFNPNHNNGRDDKHR